MRCEKEGEAALHTLPVVLFTYQPASKRDYSRNLSIRSCQCIQASMHTARTIQLDHSSCMYRPPPCMLARYASQVATPAAFKRAADSLSDLPWATTICT